MVEAKAKRRRGRPPGAKDKRPRRVKPETPPVSAYGASPAQIDEMVEDLAGNGQGGGEYDVPGHAVEPAPVEPPRPAPGPALAKLFVAAVENGYVIRPAYSDGYKGASDNRSWVVTSREELARMVSWLMAERGEEKDFLGGPYHMPQPVEPHYAPPIGLNADETVG